MNSRGTTSLLTTRGNINLAFEESLDAVSVVWKDGLRPTQSPPFRVVWKDDNINKVG